MYISNNSYNNDMMITETTEKKKEEKFAPQVKNHPSKLSNSPRSTTIQKLSLCIPLHYRSTPTKRDSDFKQISFVPNGIHLNEMHSSVPVSNPYILCREALRTRWHFVTVKWVRDKVLVKEEQVVPHCKEYIFY